MQHTRTRSSGFPVFRLVADAMLIALYVVLSSYLTVKTPIFELSWASLPILLCALIFGLPDVLAVSCLGSFLEQMLSFGPSATTVLWMLPAIFQGVFAALAFRFLKNKDSMLHLVLIIAASEFLLSAVNTAALYADGAIMGYPVPALHVIAPVRLAGLLVRAILSCVLLPLLLPRLRRNLRSHGMLDRSVAEACPRSNAGADRPDASSDSAAG